MGGLGGGLGTGPLNKSLDRFGGLDELFGGLGGIKAGGGGTFNRLERLGGLRFCTPGAIGGGAGATGCFFGARTFPMSEIRSLSVTTSSGLAFKSSLMKNQRF